jgi:hypothetical protein
MYQQAHYNPPNGTFMDAASQGSPGMMGFLRALSASIRWLRRPHVSHLPGLPGPPGLPGVAGQGPLVRAGMLCGEPEAGAAMPEADTTCQTPPCRLRLFPLSWPGLVSPMNV